MKQEHSVTGRLLQPVHVVAANEAASLRAQTIADQLELPIQPFATGGGKKKRDNKIWTLLVAPFSLQLVRPDGLAAGIDFTSDETHRRVSEPGLARQPLARAIGLGRFRRENLPLPTVVDATAGYGQDAWLIASLGCKVHMLERHPLLHLMLADALRQAHMHPVTADTAMRIQLEQADAGTWLNECRNKAACPTADVIYLDPMYPARRKRALVKKHLQILHELLGPDQHNELLLQAALAVAGSRVVVKRPKGAAKLAGSEDWQGQTSTVESPGTRFDIYHVRR